MITKNDLINEICDLSGNYDQMYIHRLFNMYKDELEERLRKLKNEQISIKQQSKKSF